MQGIWIYDFAHIVRIHISFPPAYPLPGCKNEPENFGLFLRKFLAETPINVIIPLSDGTAAYISQNKNELEKIHGVRCAVPGYEIFHKAHNKQLLMELCRRIGAPHPKTIELTSDNLVQASAYTGFPALIKPNISEGARGIVYVNDIDRLHEVFPSVQQHSAPAHCRNLSITRACTTT